MVFLHFALTPNQPLALLCVILSTPELVVFALLTFYLLLVHLNDRGQILISHYHLEIHSLLHQSICLQVSIGDEFAFRKQG